jgi:hypothetical protein
VKRAAGSTRFVPRLVKGSDDAILYLTLARRVSHRKKSAGERSGIAYRDERIY